jgi:hypothetical protein
MPKKAKLWMLILTGVSLQTHPTPCGLGRRGILFQEIKEVSKRHLTIFQLPFLLRAVWTFQLPTRNFNENEKPSRRAEDEPETFTSGGGRALPDEVSLKKAKLRVDLVNIDWDLLSFAALVDAAFSSRETRLARSK